MRKIRPNDRANKHMNPVKKDRRSKTIKRQALRIKKKSKV